MAKIKSSELEADPQLQERSQVNRAEKREDTRSKIALYYVIGYLILVFFTLVLFLIRKLVVSDLRDMLLAISGILSGPLGFIIGYYFKSYTDQE